MPAVTVYDRHAFTMSDLKAIRPLATAAANAPPGTYTRTRALRQQRQSHTSLRPCVTPPLRCSERGEPLSSVDGSRRGRKAIVLRKGGSLWLSSSRCPVEGAPRSAVAGHWRCALRAPMPRPGFRSQTNGLGVANGQGVETSPLIQRFGAAFNRGTYDVHALPADGDPGAVRLTRAAQRIIRAVRWLGLHLRCASPRLRWATDSSRSHNAGIREPTDPSSVLSSTTRVSPARASAGDRPPAGDIRGRQPVPT